MASQEIDKIAANEIYDHINNNERLYRQLESIQKNLVNKMAAGKYDGSKAPKLFIYLIEAGDKSYQKDYGSSRSGFLLNVASRKWLAIEMEKDFYRDAVAGEFKHLLHKKYQSKK